MNPKTEKNWMRNHCSEYRDNTTGEVNYTLLVEAWDSERSDGESTLDPNHPAWDWAIEVSE